ncbi:MAG: peroxiredoxin family protein [Bacteroidia bacterium]|nr:peroxiredoxin family protein [Bacteroidia bacterium]
MRELWNTIPLPTYTGLLMQLYGAIAYALNLPYAEYASWVGGLGSLLIGLDFQRFTGPIQYAATFAGNTLLALSLPYPWTDKLLLALPATIVFGLALTVRQRYMHRFTYTRYLWVEPALIGVGIFLLLKLGAKEGVMPWGAMVSALPGAVISAGYIQDAPFIVKGSSGGYAVKVGDKAPDFALQGTDGRIYRLSDFLHKNPVLLLFVRGDWCPGCHMMLRTYEKNKEKFYAKNVVILGIGPDPLGVNRDMIKRLGVSFQMLSDDTFSVIRRYGNAYTNSFLQATAAGYEAGIPLPAAYLIDKFGIVRYISSSEYVGEFLDPTTIFPVLEEIDPGEPLNTP